MLTECAVFSRRTPICSAMAMKRLLKTSSITGSASVPTATRPVRGRVRVKVRCPRSPMAACQSGSRTVVASSSAMTAGPVRVSPGRRSVRR